MTRKLFAMLIRAMRPTIAASAKEAKAEILIEATTSWDGQNLPSYPTAQPKITILKIIVPPKSRMPEHCHSIINAGVVTKGELRIVQDDGSELILRSGDAAIEVVGNYHYGVNEGSEPAELYVFYAGDDDSPLFIHKEDQGHGTTA